MKLINKTERENLKEIFNSMIKHLIKFQTFYFIFSFVILRSWFFVFVILAIYLYKLLVLDK